MIIKFLVFQNFLIFKSVLCRLNYIINLVHAENTYLKGEKKTSGHLIHDHEHHQYIRGGRMTIYNLQVGYSLWLNVKMKKKVEWNCRSEYLC